MRNYRKTDRKTRLSIATDDRTSADLLTQLATDEDAEIRQAVASNPNTPQDVLLMLGKEFPEAIVANPIFTISLLENHESQFCSLSLARSSTTSGEILANLAQLPDEEILCAIALNPNTPIAILEQLFQHPPKFYKYDDPDDSDFYRLFSCIAKNPNIPESLLIQLADCSGGNIQYAIAEHPNTPVAILEKFASWRNSTMHQAILRNNHAPTVVLEKLAGEHEDIRNLVKAHPNASEMALAIVEFMEDRPGTPVHLLEKFATHSSPQVRQLVAEHPHTPPHILELLSLDFPHQVAEHPNASANALERAVKLLAIKLQQDRQHYRSKRPDYPHQDLIKALIQRDDITTETLDTLFDMASDQTVHDMTRFATTPPDMLLKLTKCEARSQDIPRWGDLPKNPNTPAEALEIIFSIFSMLDKGKYSDFIPKAIARNPNTPVQLLEELAKQPYLHEALSRNPNTPVRLLEEFAMHPHLGASVCANHNVPSKLLRQLANVPENVNLQMIANIANNRNTPVDLLLRFVVSPNAFIREGLAGNSKAPASILEALVNDENVFVRIALAKNPSVPISILERLANDPDDRVCKSLIENPNLPAQLLELFVDAADRKVRECVAQHPNTSIGSLMRLAADREYWVRNYILKRPDLTGIILEKLAETTFAQAVAQSSFDEFLLMDIGRHPQTPIQILEMMATNQPLSLYQRFGDLLYCVREAVVENVNAPVSILENLAEDRDPRVKAAARKMLKAKYQYSA